jgi:hypothetical protein
MIEDDEQLTQTLNYIYLYIVLQIQTEINQDQSSVEMNANDKGGRSK